MNKETTVVETTRRDNWSQGANNIAQPDRLPAGAVRSLINFDASPGGTLGLRAPYSKVLATEDARAVGRVGDKLAVVTGGVTVYDPATNSPQGIPGAVSPGPVACVTHNDLLYLASPAEAWVCDGNRLVPWGVEEPAVQVSFIPGALTGVVKLSVTALGGMGEESGADPFVFNLTNQSIVVTSADPRELLVYVSPPNHESLYFQTKLSGQTTITEVRDDTERLETVDLRPLPPCERYVSFRGVIVGATGNYVYCTAPFMPHLHDPIGGFFQYASHVRMLAATQGGVFVATDTDTFFIADLEGQPTQRRVLAVGAVADSGATLPDSRAAWFTPYGQAIGSSDGAVELLNDGKFSPDLAANGAAGLVEYNGNQMVVTTMRGPVRSSGLGVGVHSTLETD